MKAKYISNSTSSHRMFKNNLIENLSKVHFTVPLFIFIPIIGYLIWRSVTLPDQSISIFCTSLISGVLCWTLTEYILHRFVFHYEPSTRWGQRIHFIFHGVHHDYPNDALRLVMPPSVSLPLATGFYLLFKAIFPEVFLYSFFAAFLSGYLFYDISHYALHHFTMKSKFWKELKQNHMRHHYSDSSKGYGVSSALWDNVLNSNFERHER
jgi:sterol desaturase/sphingolipid hydroxylase (fatty acid hydroxylase superfamily)